ncbi:MAG TPA: response regulator [Thermoplasmata archaeon]|jgi:CheY-like chemotaxis protein|nr:response regulator [Thermoplasmata archaeon]
MTELRYLIVDDSPTVRHLIVQALRTENVPDGQIAEADSADRAIEAFDRVPPDVVFLDVSLTGGDVVAGGGYLDLLHPTGTRPESGNDVARHMLSRNPALRIVVCTGNPPEDPRVRDLVRGGAFQVLQKPVHLAQIREVLRQIREEDREIHGPR